MTHQSERTLENDLVAQLVAGGYSKVDVPDEAAMLANLRRQLETHNAAKLGGVPLTDTEFKSVLNHLGRGTVFERAKTLRDKMHLVREDGSSVYLEFFNTSQWCQNEYQVAQQITDTGTYETRYDVTILINGLPLVQIELKRRGIELREAFNQINRYRRYSYSAGYGLFQYVQLFVISNGVDTKYYANTVSNSGDKKASYEFTYYWTDEQNVRISELGQFADIFLERCHLSQMIAKYIVLNESTKTLMVLRPYQYYAVEKIIDKVAKGVGGGYIWHTTGSGKTLTSFKAAQLMTENPDVDKVMFVVDRSDLDYQTIKEFNAFKDGSVDGTDSTATLVQQLADPNTKLIVTTIQKLDKAVTRQRHAQAMQTVKNKRFVFIFDECHRSQFGQTHKNITSYFTNYQLFGFTGTPIFTDNATSNGGFGKRTTKDLFGERLHEYVITDAINDGNVLKFSVEYVGRFTRREGADTQADIDVEAIDTKEAMENQARVDNIADYILANHDRKTHGRDFTAMMCVSSTDLLRMYYDAFRRKNIKLTIATIFSYQANEEDPNADSLLDEDVLKFTGSVNQSARDFLESAMGEYNARFGTNYTTRDSKSFYGYYKDIAKRVKDREIDILLVVNMFLTGFDSKTLNTLYVDKNLKYHGLLQAYSRTNRILNERKSQGNIVVFRNLKAATDNAVQLFSNKQAMETIFLKPYEWYVQEFNQKVARLLAFTPEPRSVDTLLGEAERRQFVELFREVMRTRNVLLSFADFANSDVDMNEQLFEDFKSKYLDIYFERRSSKEKVSILDEVDFELELIRRDEITVDYIIGLVAKMAEASEQEKSQLRKQIAELINGNEKLRSKRELIDKFITSWLPHIADSDSVEGEFQRFWGEQEQHMLEQLAAAEGFDLARLRRLIDNYNYTGRLPRSDEYVAALKNKPRLSGRRALIERLKTKVCLFIDTFIE